MDATTQTPFEIEVQFATYRQSKFFHAFVVVTSHHGYNKLTGQSAKSPFHALRAALINGITMLLPGMTIDDMEEWSAEFSNDAHSIQDLPYYDSREVDELFETSELIDDEIERRRSIERKLAGDG